MAQMIANDALVVGSGIAAIVVAMVTAAVTEILRRGQ